MRTPQRLALLALVGLIALGLALALALRGSPTSPPGRADSATGYEGALLPTTLLPHDFILEDQRSRRVSLGDYRGKVAVLTFLDSTSPGSSALMAQQIRGALDELGSAAPPALAVSIDPAGDTPAHVGAFLRAVSLTGRLEYLNGPPTRLRAIWRAYRIVPPRAGHKGPDRSAYVLLIDRRGVERVRFGVEQLTPEGLTHDIRKLQGD